MSPRLVPIYFDPGRDAGFDTQLEKLRTLLSRIDEVLLFGLKPAP